MNKKLGESWMSVDWLQWSHYGWPVWLMALMLVVLLAYGLTCLTLWRKQDRLLFHRPSEHPMASQREDLERLEVEVDPGIVLRGWIRRSELNESPQNHFHSKSKGLVLYFGGNAEDVSGFVMGHRLPQGWSVASLNYRGFGKSDGMPSTDLIRRDALEIFDCLRSMPEFQSVPVVVFGRSLGTGVATWVASKRPVERVVLVSPYDSLKKVAAEHFQFIPVGWLMKHELSAAEWAASTTAPVFVAVGLRDQVVSPNRSQSLLASWAGVDKRWFEIEHAGHWLYHDDRLWDCLSDFLTTSSVQFQSMNNHLGRRPGPDRVKSNRRDPSGIGLCGTSWD